ncbi:unnamed protein product [Darwinula stevensoni]|uniref:Pyruvate dehydrogenase E1 component middle domain-containing protein n=1 Tax=Darwinula stevensoni TaxID=69355 RepID=A0A7R9AF54_9CRUS|nr:unnamed protein product [Darwinula stevensoni]CAG0902596.1 unnamed protein product [Darwinula stevensoni]
MKRLMEVVDGEYQTYKSKDGAYIRQHLFNTPELAELVADYSDEDLWNLNRGGHDPYKVFAAYHEAVHHKGQPTVILAKTVKGYDPTFAYELAVIVQHGLERMVTKQEDVFYYVTVMNENYAHPAMLEGEFAGLGDNFA